MSQRPEFVDHTRQHEHYERGEYQHQHQNSFFSHSEYQHVSQSRHGQAKHDTQSAVQKGHLPVLDLFNDHHQADHHQNHGGHHSDASKHDEHHHHDKKAAHNNGGLNERSDQPGKPTAQKNGDTTEAGGVKFTGLHGAAVDTDGSGAKNHKEDRTRQNQTTLKDSHGHSLDTDHDKFVALPREEMRKKGIQLGDHGYLERADTGAKVPVVFGDVSSGKEWKHGKGQPEASVAALKALGFNNVNGSNGVAKTVPFSLTMAPHSHHEAETEAASR